MDVKNTLFLTIYFIALFAFSSTAQECKMPYDYPVKPGTEEWKGFASRDQKSEHVKSLILFCRQCLLPIY